MITYLFLGLRIIMAAALYSFLGWTMLAMWRSLDQYKQQKLGSLIPALSIAFSNHKFNDQSFQQATIRIGRSANNQCQIDDATISSRHASLNYHHKQWWLEDQQSKNGTFLNGEKISEPIVISSQDKIRCGKIGFVVEIAPA